jgi:hypothetical protein
MPHRTRSEAKRAALAALAELQRSVMGNNDLLAAILTALNRGNLDDACSLAMRWCETHKDACTDDTWRHLLGLVFPTNEGAEYPKMTFVALCRRWTRGRKARYNTMLTNYEKMWPDHPPRNSTDEEWMTNYLADNFGYDVDEDDDYTDFMDAFDPQVDDENYAVWFLCAYFIGHEFANIRRLLLQGYLHVSQTLEPPVDGNANAFPRANTLLGLAVLGQVLPDDVETLLNFGADPNQPPVEANHEYNEDGSMATYDYRNGGGPAELLAKRHIQETMGQVDARFFNSHHGPPSGWHDTLMPNPMVDGQTVMGRRSRLLAIFGLLNRYGGDVLNAAMIYRAHAARFPGFVIFHNMANALEEIAQYTHSRNGARVATAADRAACLNYHARLMDELRPYREEEDEDSDEDSLTRLMRHVHSTDEEDDDEGSDDGILGDQED